mmetsp:Transcript_17719/g.35739  ORF Transcript_17719/g.35739 Transcript_17719/m.35739 type:complete len:118 (+) Transcript_17719:183-536(+)
MSSTPCLVPPTARLATRLYNETITHNATSHDPSPSRPVEPLPPPLFPCASGRTPGSAGELMQAPRLDVGKSHLEPCHELLGALIQGESQAGLTRVSRRERLARLLGLHLDDELSKPD